jgi:RNA polymerase sigma factor (sigma-70 family)
LLSAEKADAQLLEGFVKRNDQSAFEGLVRRHGPMIFRVCTRLLGNEHDAADAFQAVFMVLARKAASLRRPEVLGAWLYHVAYRASLKARTVRSKRTARERQVTEMPETAVHDPEFTSDLAELLDRELQALPAKYQAPIILCDLEGLSRRHIAASLKIPEGTLKTRLATARKRLAQRLRSRGGA